MEAPAHRNGCVPAPMSDAVILEELARGVEGCSGGNRGLGRGGGFLQICIWPFRHRKMVKI